MEVVMNIQNPFFNFSASPGLLAMWPVKGSVSARCCDGASHDYLPVRQSRSGVSGNEPFLIRTDDDDKRYLEVRCINKDGGLRCFRTVWIPGVGRKINSLDLGKT
jgi:hypothetical protein